MKIGFLGAADGVTGSRHLVELGGQRILLDCGLFQGCKLHRQRNWARPEALREVDAVVLSHAHIDHIDHSGWLSPLVAQGYRGPIHASPATCELAAVMQPPHQTFVVHGEPDAADTLRALIQQRLGWRARVPLHGELVEIG